MHTGPVAMKIPAEILDAEVSEYPTPLEIMQSMARSAGKATRRPLGRVSVEVASGEYEVTITPMGIVTHLDRPCGAMRAELTTDDVITLAGLVTGGDL